MLIVETPYDLESYEGTLLGTTEWKEITQDMIDDFARISGDNNWIHVDVSEPSVNCLTEKPLLTAC